MAPASEQLRFQAGAVQELMEGVKPEPVTVTCRHGTFAGFRIGRAAAYEFQVNDDDPRARGHRVRPEFPEAIQRVFLLLDEHIQLNQPILETSYWDGWWYVDLVHITELGSSITVIDRYIDLIVPPHVAPYRILDLNEYGEAIEVKETELDAAARDLRRLQAFLDSHLHDRVATMTDWPDFPPSAIRDLQTLPRWLNPR